MRCLDQGRAHSSMSYRATWEGTPERRHVGTPLGMLG